MNHFPLFLFSVSVPFAAEATLALLPSQFSGWTVTMAWKIYGVNNWSCFKAVRHQKHSPVVATNYEQIVSRGEGGQVQTQISMMSHISIFSPKKMSFFRVSFHDMISNTMDILCWCVKERGTFLRLVATLVTTKKNFAVRVRFLVDSFFSFSRQ